MDKYLQQILNEVNTIIIPGLGALTLTSKATGDIMFMSFLKHDDGNLSKYIAEKENIAENDAKNVIAKHVREIQSKLDSGDTYDMYQFGRFIKKSGEIEFENWNNYQHDTPALAPEVKPVSEEKPLELIEEPRIETITEAAPIVAAIEPEPIVEKAPEPKIEVVKEPEPIIEAPKAEEAKIDVSAIKPDENVYIPAAELKDLEKKQLEEKVIPAKPVPAAKVTKPAAPVAPKVPKEKKKRSPMFWALIIVGIVLLAGGATTAIFFSEVKDFLNGKTEKTETMLAEKQKQESAEEKIKEQEAMEDQVALESEPVAEEQPPVVNEPEPVKEEIVKTPKASPTPSGSGGSYHIIAGGFASESNATRFAEKLQGEGKSSSVLGKFDDLFLVSYESFGTQEEAASALKSAAIKGWVFKYPK